MTIKTNLPIEEVISDIRRALAGSRGAVLAAPPGAGKTTVVPLALLDEDWLDGRRIIMLEPRRLAARCAATRMSELLGEDAGMTVGYRTRFDSRISPATRIEVVTEGILTRIIQGDPSLSGIGLVIFDEFHERSIHADLGLALCLEAQSILRDDLRILVMSATLDCEGVSSLLGNAPVIRSEGRSFPVETHYLPHRPPAVQNVNNTAALVSLVVDAVIKAVLEHQGSILVFLPGGAEIRRAQSLLREKGLPSNLDIAPLYGDLPSQAQDTAIRPSPAGRRKIVLATSIAETSLTIEGVRVVIDSGLMRVPRFSPATGMGSLDTVRVTSASADQRRGRAGRIEPGICVRLWTEAENSYLKKQNTPEILEADLVPLALDMAVWGAKGADELRWLDRPPAGALSQARELLIHLGAIDSSGSATEHGRAMAKLPLHPRLSHMVIKGKALGLGNLACELAALLSERDIMRVQTERDSDIRLRVEAVRGRQIDGAARKLIAKAAAQMKRILDIRPGMDDIEKTGILLAFAYPDRVARRRPGSNGRYLLANGCGAYFPEPEPLSSEEYIVAASLDGSSREARIFLAAPVYESEISAHFMPEIKEEESVTWDARQKAVAARKRRMFWNIVIEDAPVTDLSDEKAADALLAGLRTEGLAVLPWDRESENIRARVCFLNRISGQFPDLKISLPDFSDMWMLDNLEQWLAPWITGMTRLEHVRKIDLHNIILKILTWEQKQTLDRLAPVHIKVPSGSSIPVDYLSGERPALAVRLQEMFGLAKTPAIVEGRAPIVLRLLSPAGRPMQITEDLAGFWSKSYELVKKDMKGRYPKHYWPDDPLQAEPTNRAKRQRG